jgi:hypothetical protein
LTQEKLKGTSLLKSTVSLDLAPFAFTVRARSARTVNAGFGSASRRRNQLVENAARSELEQPTKNTSAMPKQSETLNQKFIERAGLPFASVLDEAEIQRHWNLTRSSIETGFTPPVSWFGVG